MGWWWCASQTQGPWNVNMLWCVFLFLSVGFSCYENIPLVSQIHIYVYSSYMFICKHIYIYSYESNTPQTYIHWTPGNPQVFFLLGSAAMSGGQHSEEDCWADGSADSRGQKGQQHRRDRCVVYFESRPNVSVESTVSWRVVVDLVEISPKKIGRIDPLIMVDCPTSHVRLPYASWTFEIWKSVVVVMQFPDTLPSNVCNSWSLDVTNEVVGWSWA